MTLTSKHPLIGQRFPIGSHGFVELLDFMGSDQDIAEAAWVSTEFGNLNKSPVPQFLDYLMRHKHWSPFEMCDVKLRVSMPLFVEAQWVTHRTSSKNQASARYVILPDNKFTPQLWRAGTTGHNKQGSDAQGLTAAAQYRANEIYDAYLHAASTAEQALRDLGVAPELSRIVQPQSQYTMKVWKMNLRNLMNFLAQRTDSHAQEEIRDYADAIEELLNELFPHAMDAWRNHVKLAVTFSLDEQTVLADLIYAALTHRSGGSQDPDALSDELDSAIASSTLRASRRAELRHKIQLLLDRA